MSLLQLNALVVGNGSYILRPCGHDLHGLTETMNLARDIANTKMPADEFIKQWKNKHDNETRIRNKNKQREPLEKWLGEYLTPSRDQKDPETSSTISMGYNTMGASTYQKDQQITEYEPNVSEITMVSRPIVTRYRADVPKEVLDNIPTFCHCVKEVYRVVHDFYLYFGRYFSPGGLRSL